MVKVPFDALCLLIIQVRPLSIWSNMHLMHNSLAGAQNMTMMLNMLLLHRMLRAGLHHGP